ncbi:PalH-domain-containing protein [Lentithecium fluviatile CBS 122367]|uniref:PalH-domain-containing protein n=1 Tax=Lentithecium fluviatile CBS 122367 TaxID=1168545 RepID=A0A6G1ITD0_9PLEO|nr:PalH-domain-containing protein [Lentithecium fluviatile CBS 122367]
MDDPGPWWKRAQSTNNEAFSHCTPFTLPSLGVIQLSADHYITLEADAVFTPACPTTEQSQVNGNLENEGGVWSFADMRDPFHASITPQAYATGAATVIAWMLVIMLLITPRTFFVGGTSGGSGLLGRRGMISGATGRGSIIGVGTRPWLQKVAALTVAISLTLATADTFKIAQRQYASGYMDAVQLRDEVVAGMEIKVSRVISDVFLWLAQVQTLIRLFPRHQEKVVIKWVGFALILLDITFTSLNSFGAYNDKRNPRHFETAIPALSYLFQLSLSMLYAAWVMYYTITKRRVAFYHHLMPNISLVALLSVVAILTPVVFFITDISNYTIAGWGDYFRWVGAAAASVIVWEWVERIEALEREERKDGILGREIYDGDEMLDATPSRELNWPRHSYMPDDMKKPGDGEGGGAHTSAHMSRFNNIAHRMHRKKQPERTESHKKRTIHVPAPPAAIRRSESGQRSIRDGRPYVPLQSPPPAIASPVSRTDTTSADSTVYAVFHHTITDTPPIPGPAAPTEERGGTVIAPEAEAQATFQSRPPSADPEKGIVVTGDPNTSGTQGRWNWQAIASVNPFRRKGRAPPPEVQRGRVIEPLVVEDVPVPVNIPQRNYTGLALKDRLGTLAAQQGERFRSKKSTGQQVDTNLPVTIIPAQPRGRTWSPEILKQSQQEEEVTNVAGIQVTQTSPRPVPTSVSDDRHRSASSEESTLPSASNRTSHIRFTPETFQRPSARQQPEDDSSPAPTSSSRPGPTVTSHDGELAPHPDVSIISQQTPTNHDR